MNKRERVSSALAGQAVDRPPVGFWRHWPGDDQQEGTLVQATLNFQHQWDLDFIKLPVSSTYAVSDWGVKHEYQGSPNGDRAYLERAIKKPQDWAKIDLLNIESGTYGWTLAALRSVIRQKDKDTPLVVTMFNPLSVDFYLAGDETCLVHMRTHAKEVEAALEAITQTSVRFARAVIEAGADGIFLSAKQASFGDMSEAEYRRFGQPGDLKVLAAASKGWFNILHLHGQHPMIELVSGYPAQALNWHDRTTRSLSEVSRLFKGALMGGVEQYKVLHFGRPAEVRAQVEDAIAQMKGKRLIVSPGCTYPITVPQMNLAALKEAALASKL
jgi:uroporphyrinogen decarboxylase